MKNLIYILIALLTFKVYQTEKRIFFTAHYSILKTTFVNILFCSYASALIILTIYIYNN